MQTMTSDELRTQLRISVDIIDTYVVALARKDKTILAQEVTIEKLQETIEYYHEKFFGEVPKGGEGSE